MSEATQTVEFTASDGTMRTGELTRPAGPARATALFPHDAPAAAEKIAGALARQGIAVLRFRCAGQAGNISPDDLINAGKALQAAGLAPSLLIGHARGGTAALLAAGRMPDITGIVTINAPASTGQMPQETVAAQVRAIRRPLLILHAPLDQSVSVDQARYLFGAAMHPKSFISLDTADHELSGESDAPFTAQMIAAWAGRYLPAAPARDDAEDARAVSVAGEPYAIELAVGAHRFLSDAGREEGGSDLGPNPTELMEAALAACSAMTVRMYARRKKWDLQAVDVRIRPGGGAKSHHLTEVEKRATFTGNLDTEQIARLEEILARCPVHIMLSNGVNIVYRKDL